MSKKHTFDFVKNYIETNSSFVVITTEDEYENSSFPLITNCQVHGDFKLRLGNFRKKHTGCKKCFDDSLRHSIDYIKEKTSEAGYKLVSKEYKGNKHKIEVECSKHGIFKTMFNSIQGGHGCAKCAKDKISILFKHSYDDVKKYIEMNTPYKLVSTEYVNSKAKLDLECPVHGVIQMSYKNISKGHGCSRCSNEKTESAGETQCREIFQRLTGKEFVNVRPKFMINPESGKKLQLDGYCEELNLAFEYDGIQHYKSIEFFGGEERFLHLQHLDKIKDTLCINNSINLIRVPYNIENIEQHIKQELEMTWLAK